MNSDHIQIGGGPHPANRAKVLYLSYDGMCDPLGGSQVLPYLTGLARRDHSIDLISFEKPERGPEDMSAVADVCARAGIRWHPLRYHKRPPLLSSIYDVRQMLRAAVRLHKRKQFDLVHCRSYLPALVGLRMKRRFGLPFIFDMRGFWADERVDGGIWRLSNPLYGAVYRHFKRREAEFLAEADHVISLTEEGKTILASHHRVAGPMTVIPCCVDYESFPAVTASDRAEARRLLGIKPDATVVTYLGSFGSWYMVSEMLDFFRVQLEGDPRAIFLIISREPAAEIIATAEAHGIARDRLVVRAASRAEVPVLAAAADYGLFFIKPVFSKKASSPTKMGEFLALELPIVTNGGVGDVARIVEETGAGVLVDGFDDRSYRVAMDALGKLNPDKTRWRAAARHWFDLETGVQRYNAIYEQITEPGRV